MRIYAYLGPGVPEVACVAPNAVHDVIHYLHVCVCRKMRRLPGHMSGNDRTPVDTVAVFPVSRYIHA
jgi:hypothetical protein